MLPPEQFLNEICARIADAWPAQVSRNTGRGLYVPYYLYYKRAQGPQDGDLILAAENPGIGWELASPMTFEGNLTRYQVFFRVMQIANNLPIYGYAGLSTLTPIAAPVVAATKTALGGDEPKEHLPSSRNKRDHNWNSDEEKLEELKKDVHAYWDQRAKLVIQYNLENEDAAEVLYYKDFLRTMGTDDVIKAADDFGITLTPKQAKALRQEIIDWGGEKFTTLKRAGIYKLKGELVGYEIGEVEEPIGNDDEWAAIQAKFGADFVKANFDACVESYRGDMTISGNFGYVNLDYERWVLVLNDKEVRSDFIGSEEDPDAA
jgi:hypothetical protein